MKRQRLAFMVQYMAIVSAIQFQALADADQSDIGLRQRLIAIPTQLDGLKFFPGFPSNLLTNTSPGTLPWIFTSFPADMDQVVGDVLFVL